MKKTLLIFSVFLLLAGQVHAKNVYCTDRNWKTGIDLYKKYEGKYNEQVQALNESVGYFNAFGFLSKRFEVKKFSEMWRDDNTEIRRVVDVQKELCFERVSELDNIKKKVLDIIEGLDKSRRLWNKLADYCYDEDRYGDYKLGRNNMRAAISTKKKADELMSKINRMRLAYMKEIGFINQSKDVYEENCGCSVK